MSSGSPAPSVVALSTSSVAPSAGTLESTPTRKKRTIVVVRRRPPDNRVSGSSDEDDDRSQASPKKRTLLVSRRPRASEGQLFDDTSSQHHLPGISGAGPLGGGKRRGSNREHLPPTITETLEWLPGGHVVDSSVLGTAAAFEEIDTQLRWAARPEEREEDLLHSGTESSLRTMQSQRSKQSLRSVRSARLQSIDGSVNGRGSQLGMSPEDGADLQQEMERYLRRIAEAENTAIRNRAASERKEAKLMEHVGLTEKLTMQREGNSMRQWKRRQRDWQCVSQDMAAKTGKVPQDLVMSTADEYRERSEEYQLIQCAVPTCEKFSSDMFWVMSLRGFGERKCNVGNIFSGLTCAINDRVPPPRAALAARKRHLAPTLKSLRPQQFEPDETGRLLVQGEGLLEWAAKSSQQYFRLRHLQESEAVIAGLKALERESTVGDENDTTALATTGNPHLSATGGELTGTGTGFVARDGPAMEVFSPKTLLIETKAGGKALKQATLTMRNTGSTVLFYSWSRVPRRETIVTVNGLAGGGTGEGLAGPGSGARTAGMRGSREPEGSATSGKTPVAPSAAVIKAAARHAALQSPDGRFFCFQTTGTLLPGETATTSFSFKTADAGVFSDRWRLETAPSAAFIFSTPLPRPSSAQNAADAVIPAGLSNNLLDEPGVDHKLLDGPALTASGSTRGGSSGGPTHAALRRRSRDEKRERRGAGSAGSRGGIEVGLTGVALAPDTRGHVRKRLSEGVARGVFGAKVEEIVREVVRGVQTPIREEEIRRRQRMDFVSTNAEQGLYFTPRLYDGFMALLQRARAIAHAAGAGMYDVETRSNNGDVEGDQINGSDTPARMHNHAPGAEAEERTTQNGLESVLTSITKSRTSRNGVIKTGDDDSEKESEQSECSTRPVSARSSSGGSEASLGGEGNGLNAREDEDDASKVRYQATVVAVSKNAESERNLATVGGMETKSGHVDDEPTIAAVDRERGTDSSTNRSQEMAEGEDDERGDGRKGGDQARGDEALLRGMLESLNCAEWDGAVTTVLDAIEDLTNSTPPRSRGHFCGLWRGVDGGR
ncbi:unnamed protein product [Scytosiphon promiscuus]